METSQSSPGMEQLIVENTALKQENAELREANEVLFDLTDKYNEELTEMNRVLEQTTDKLVEAYEFIEKGIVP